MRIHSGFGLMRFNHALLWLLVAGWLVCPLQAVDRHLTPGIEELYRLDRLAEFKGSLKVASVSSYDRTGGNNDGFGGEYSFVRKEENGLVLADLQGPGVIYRIWTPTPTDDLMEFFFDGEPQPRIQVKFREIFTGTHPVFERPLVGFGAGGFYSYVPLTYEKSCKVLIRANRMRFYQINYATYPLGTGIKTFSEEIGPQQRNHIEKAKSLFGSAGKDISSYVIPNGVKSELISTKVALNPGEVTKLWEIQRPGRIVGIRIKPAAVLAGKMRDVILRAYWDGDAAPAILVPAGDFFGYAWGEPAMQSLLVGTANNVSYCYFPMPFDKSARLELYSEPGVERGRVVEAEIVFAPRGREENEGKFYALWRRENPTTQGKPFTFIDTGGQGHLVGVVHQAQGLQAGNTYFFEGDDQTTIDGELVIHGTGSEDFYNGGWYDVPGRWETRRSFVLSGCLAYKKHLGRTGGYRIFLGDTYSYGQSLRQTIEHAPTHNDLLTDYTAVTYLYSRQRPTCDFQLPPAEQRVVSDPNRIVFAAGWNVPIHAFSLEKATLTKQEIRLPDEKRVRFISLRGMDQEAFGPHLISFICELPSAGTYRIALDVLKGPEQGKVQLFLDEAPVAPEVDLYSPSRRVSAEYFGTLTLDGGPNNLMFKLVGRNEKSNGLGFDLINIICERTD
ncbi:MAG: glycoside hydrolase family 172 protein [Acidobacteriota bacterium]